METSQGLVVSTKSVDAVEQISHFHHQVLSSGLLAADIINAATKFPDEILIQAYAGAFHLFAQEQEASETALGYLKQSKVLSKHANEREKLIVDALLAWYENDYERAIIIFSAISTLYPRDTLSLKFAEWLFYCVGQSYSGPRYLALCNTVAHENQHDPFFLSCYSFAQELSGQFKLAERTAKKAMELETATPWAHHTMAHALLMSGKIEQCGTFLEQVKPSWETIMPLLRVHNTWHYALCHLANRDESLVISLYTNELWNENHTFVGTQLDAISLLWRMDLAGMPQDVAYSDIANHLNQHPYEHFIGFNTVHFIYSLARTGDNQKVEKALDQIKQYIETIKVKNNKSVWQDVSLPICQAVYAYVNQDYQTALELLSPIIMKCYRLGGSDAQCDMFLQTYLMCLLKCQRFTQAKSFFDHHLRHYHNTALHDYWFGGDAQPS